MTDAAERDVWTVRRREVVKGVGAVGTAAVVSDGLAERVLAQSGGPDNEISGTVEDSNGAVENATVVAVPHSASLDPLVTTTDASGAYLFDEAALHTGDNLYHVINRDGTESSPRRGEQNYPFIAANGGTAIPDSVVLQHFATEWDQGDDTWPDDTGTADMSITGDPQDGTLSDGSESADFDGADDHGEIPLPSEFEGSGLNEWSIEFAADWTTTNLVSLAGILGDNDQHIRIEINKEEDFTAETGNFGFRLMDTDLNEISVAPTDNPNLDDGNRHDISIIVNDAANSDVSIIIDGVDVSVSYTQQGNPDNFGTWANDFAVAARANPSDLEADVNIGAIRWHDEAISSQTIGDYS